eukprot:TRINITY_DN4912_c0_g1_i1.p1 TRINITY_DN4912_c0_g1~~TRINITY_DN4912_c0_g1_i1.p1  ORF type:complete len:292 (+),score=45.44 TRINITY_DN4912_c0_g1_i1:134-1009(+)
MFDYSISECEFNLPCEISTQVVEGEELNGYQVLTVIGEGAYGKVYHAIDPKNPNASLVIKSIEKNGTNTSRISEEIAALRLLAGVEGIPQLHHHFTEGNAIHLVMDKVDGEDLYDFMNRKNFSCTEEETRIIAKKIIRILHECHRRGVAHKDIKLENIMISKEGEIYLIDFGLCFRFRSEQEDENCSDDSGSLPYASPEVVTKKRFSATKADVFSLGVTLHALLFGCMPEINSRNNGKYPKIKLPKGQVTPEALDFVLSMLKSPKYRSSLKKLMLHRWLNSGSRPSSPVVE